jgi:hypothetical protein
LAELGRPNASAKTTIFVGARMYIELLQRRVKGLERKVEDLEKFRRAVGGDVEFERWRSEFTAREQERERLEVKLEVEDEGSEDEESEEEEQPKKKRGRKKGTTNKPKESKDSLGVTAFAAFATTFSLLPSAGTVFNAEGGEVGLGHVFTGEATRGEVLRRLPVITAEHAERLLKRGLPGVMVPSAGSIVDWTWRAFVGVVLALLVGWLFRRKRDDRGVGRLSVVLEDAGKAVIGRREGGEEWTGLAAAIVGKGKSGSVHEGQQR